MLVDENFTIVNKKLLTEPFKNSEGVFVFCRHMENYKYHHVFYCTEDALMTYSISLDAFYESKNTNRNKKSQEEYGYTQLVAFNKQMFKFDKIYVFKSNKYLLNYEPTIVYIFENIIMKENKELKDYLYAERNLTST